jgi:hypothetical protein
MGECREIQTDEITPHHLKRPEFRGPVREKGTSCYLSVLWGERIAIGVPAAIRKSHNTRHSSERRLGRV